MINIRGAKEAYAPDDDKILNSMILPLMKKCLPLHKPVKILKLSQLKKNPAWTPL
jgi:hypothetical protein